MTEVQPMKTQMDPIKSKASSSSMSVAPTVSIIVVSYNTCKLTLDCLASIFQQTHTPFEVIFIDNGSTDGTVDAVEQKFSGSINIVENVENLGFAAGNNVAALQALGKYVLLLNPDTIVLDNAIDHLVEFARSNPDAKIWGGRTLFPDGTLNPSSCWAFPSLWSVFCQTTALNAVFRSSKLFNPEAIGGWNRSGIRNVDVVSGCFFLIDKDAWLQLGGFDSDFYMYGEEVDLCLRARKLGYGPMVTGRATIVHYGGASERVRTDKVIKVMRAKVQLMRKHFSGFHRRLIITIFSLMPFSRMLGFRLAATAMPSKFRLESDTWRQIWARRREWLSNPKVCGEVKP